MAKLPWYSFLYRLLGVHGTFWLWVVAVLTVWWTAEPAILRFSNQRPVPVTVAAASRPQAFTRWVQVEGLSVSFDRRLLLRNDQQGSPPLRFLLDPSDPAAVWWEETRRLCDAARGEGGSGTVGGILGLVPVQAQNLLIQRFARLGREPESFLPVPERGLLVLTPDTPSLSAAPAPPATAHAGDGFDASFFVRHQQQIDLVRQRVHPGDRFVGVLHETPPVVVRRIGEDLQLVPAPSLLIAGRKPRELERVVFGVAVLCLVLLTAGLFGARRAERPAANAPAEASA